MLKIIWSSKVHTSLFVGQMSAAEKQGDDKIKLGIGPIISFYAQCQPSSTETEGRAIMLRAENKHSPLLFCRSAAEAKNEGIAAARRAGRASLFLIGSVEGGRGNGAKPATALSSPPSFVANAIMQHSGGKGRGKELISTVSLLRSRPPLCAAFVPSQGHSPLHPSVSQPIPRSPPPSQRCTQKEGGPVEKEWWGRMLNMGEARIHSCPPLPISSREGEG